MIDDRCGRRDPGRAAAQPELDRINDLLAVDGVAEADIVGAVGLEVAPECAMFSIVLQVVEDEGDIAIETLRVNTRRGHVRLDIRDELFA